MMTNTQTVFIIDDNTDICDALRWLCESVNLQVETFSSAIDFLNVFNPKQVGCLLVDVRMPQMSGLELIETLNLQIHNLSMIVITGYGDIPMAVRAMKAGAVDFILKPFNDQHLLEIIQKCLNKSQINMNLNNISERLNYLTDREHQILNLIIEGKLNKEISFELAIAISTVEAHRARIMQKMKVKTLAELIKICINCKYGKKEDVALV